MRRSILNPLLGVAIACMPLIEPQADGARPERAPIVIAHRGASGYLPEHTLEAYALAIELGADYIEPDLVATRDGHLIARHEPNLIESTDIKDFPQFAARKRKALIDDVEVEGFFASDFTLAEIKKLGAVQQFPEREQSFNGKFKIPSFDEIIALAKRKAKEKKRVIGIYPETKHPSYHQALGLALEERLIAALKKARWNHRGAPVFIQSFETANLKYLRRHTAVRLILLLGANGVKLDGTLDFSAPFDKPQDWRVSGEKRSYVELISPQGLAEISAYADGIGVWKRYVVGSRGTDANGDGQADDVNGDGVVDEADRSLLPPSSLIANAHQAGLLVHAWTFRNEQHRLAADYRRMPVNEYLQFYRLGIDGVFSDFPDTAVTARALFRLDSAYLSGLTPSARSTLGDFK